MSASQPEGHSTRRVGSGAGGQKVSAFPGGSRSCEVTDARRKRKDPFHPATKRLCPSCLEDCPIQFADKTSLDVAGIARLLRSEAAAYLASPAALTDTATQKQAKLASYGVTSIVNEGAATGSVSGTSSVDAILIGTGDKTVNGSGAAEFYVYGADGGNVIINDTNYGGESLH